MSDDGSFDHYEDHDHNLEGAHHSPYDMDAGDGGFGGF